MPQNRPERLENLISLSSEMSKIKDIDVLMEMILRSARNFLNCDAGSIYIKQGGELEFRYTQNDTIEEIEPQKKFVLKSFRLPINHKSIAGYVAATGETLNIPDVYKLSDKLSYKFEPVYDEISSYRTHSLLTFPLKAASGSAIGVLQLINALDEKGVIIPFDPANAPYVEYFAGIAANALERALLMRTMILRMIKMTELRDPKETGNHVYRVAGYSTVIYETWAKNKGLPKAEIFYNKDILKMAAMLHDVGKTAIPDDILKKPGKLTPEEYEIIKTHSLIGAQILYDPLSEYERAAQEVALNHHERFDGRGYPGYVDVPTGLALKNYGGENGRPLAKKGKEIPLFGRIVAIADVYDALAFPRVYKEAWEHDRVLATIWEERGNQFDPEIVDALFECLLVVSSIAEKYFEKD